MYKGHLKCFILKALNERPLSGYGVIKQLGNLTGKRPSSGSVYPVMEDLVSQGLISSKKSGRGMLYTPTQKGRLWLKRTREQGEEVHKAMEQLMGLFSTLLDESDMGQIRMMLEAVNDEKNKAKFVVFKDEMLPLKIELFRIAKEGKKAKVDKALKILKCSAAELKRI